MKKAKFRIASYTGQYEGYTDGSNWNGWECPHFEKEVADRIAKKMTGKYLDEADAYDFNRGGADDFELYKGESITVDGKQITTYAIGAYGWVWEKVGSK